MRSGSMRHLIHFEEPTITRDSLGGEVKTWSSLITQEWVQIIPLKGDERYRSSKLDTEVTHKIRLRYRSDINSKMRIIHEGRTFKIDSILNVYEKDKEQDIMATEVFDL